MLRNSLAHDFEAIPDLTTLWWVSRIEKNSDKGIHPDVEKIQALRNFQAPKNWKELRSFLGLVAQFGAFEPDTASITSHLRQPLQKDTTWIWLPEHKLTFDNTKAAFTSPTVLQPFDQNLKTDLPLYNVETQSRYSTVEIECLAIINTVTKCHYYLAGIKSFEVWTDHRLLIGAFDKHLDLLQNQRLMRMREKLTSYSFKVIWSPRKTHHIAEALSRAHLFRPCELTFEHEDINSCLRTNKSQYIKR